MEDKNIFVNKIILLLYFMVAFVPNLGAHEIVNTQWFYIAIVNLLSLSYVFIRRKEYDLHTTSKLALSVFTGGFLFLIISLLSITKSILVSESIVSLIYLVLTLVALFVFYIVLKQEPKKYFNFFAVLIVFLGFIESLQVLNYFTEHNKEVRSNELLKGIIHNYGNRNILAISIVMKLPFLFYLFIQKKKLLKILLLFTLFIVFTAILLIGARTAIYGGIILLIFMLVYLFLINLNNRLLLLKEFGLLLLVSFMSLFLSLNLNKINRNKLNSFDDLVLTKEKKDIVYAKRSLVKAKEGKELVDDSGRSKYWSAAVEDIKRNPFFGVGIGNWKLMPKGKLVSEAVNGNYFYPKRVHNDFLQVFSEVGVFGFFNYLILYIIIFFSLFKLVLKNIKESKKDELLIVVVLFSSLFIYFLDSFFNFPHERAPIQVFAFLLLALVLIFSPNKINFKIGKLPVFIILLLLSGSFLLVSFKNYQASKIHKFLYSDFVGKDFFNVKYDISYEEMLTMLPSFPELDAYGRPISIIKAFYAYNSKRKEKAVFHLSEASESGPYHAEPMGIKALLYYQDKDLINKDSALYYAKKSFEIQPAKKENFEILRRIYDANNDTVNLIKTLNHYTKIRPKVVDAWIKKAEHLYKYNKDYDSFLKIIDSAYAFNPSNETIKEYRNKQPKLKKQDIKPKMSSNATIEKHYNLGIKYFDKKEYTKARKELHKVLHISPNNMAALVNLGVLERITKNYETSIKHLTKVIDANFMKNGQPEYNRGLSYHKLGKNKKAIESLELSKIKGYSSAQKKIDEINK